VWDLSRQPAFSLAYIIAGQLAERYIAEEKLNFQRVAFLLGAADQSFLSVAFKRRTGLMPKEDAKAQWQDGHGTSTILARPNKPRMTITRIANHHRYWIGLYSFMMPPVSAELGYATMAGSVQHCVTAILLR